MERLLNQVLSKKQFLEREKRRCQLTLNELQTLPKTTSTYKAVGKYTIYYRSEYLIQL